VQEIRDGKVQIDAGPLGNLTGRLVMLSFSHPATLTSHNREHERRDSLEMTGTVWGSVHQGISPGPKKHNDAESGSRCRP
jgi:hypothetical protein